jgi:heat shock protein HslJ
MTSVANASSSLASSNKDFAYTANRDTTLSGTWVLDGMGGEGGNLSSTQSQNADSSTATDTAMVVSDASANPNTDSTMSSVSEDKGTAKRGKGKSGNNRKALYDAAQARLQLDYKSTSTLDTTVQPVQYWTRTPSVTLNASKLVFTGTTGCNSMSGSFNFNNKDIQFGSNIITSKMSCNDYDETNFISALKKADNYTLNGNRLELKQGGTLLLTFRKA